MRQRRLARRVLALAVATAAGLTACRPSPETAREARLRIAASVPPLAWIAERVGGPDVALEVLVPAGTDPHTFDPSPRRLAAWETADLFVAVGHPAFPYEARFLDLLAASPSRRVLEVAAPDLPDPHVWLDPPAMARFAAVLADAMGVADPAHRDGYRQRAAALAEELDRLDRELAATLGAARPRVFVVDHPAWGAFTARYGLTALALEPEGKEAGPRELAETVERARTAGVRTVVVRSSASDRLARRVAADLGADLVVLDPMAPDWPATLRALARALAGPEGA